MRMRKVDLLPNPRQLSRTDITNADDTALYDNGK